MEPLFIESRLVGATVYTDRARLIREGRVELTAGVSRFAWPDLPAELDPAELQVETDQGRIRAVNVMPVDVRAEQEPAADPRAEALVRLTATQEALRAELEMLDSIAPPRESGADNPNVDAFFRGLDALAERRRAALRALREANDAHDKAARAVEAAEIEAQRRRAPERRMVTVTVEADAAGPACLRLSYPGGWATWRPVYHLALEPGADRVDLIRYADIWQETDEDWTQVALRLSTAEPAAGLRLAAVSPWMLKLTAASTDDATDALRRRPRPPVRRAPDMATEAVGAPLTVVAPEAKGSVATIEVDPPDDFDEHATQFEELGLYSDVTSPGAPFVSAMQDKTLIPTASDFALPPGTADDPDDDDPGAPTPEGVDPRPATRGADIELAVVRPFTARSGPDRHRVQLGRRDCAVRLWYVLRPARRSEAFARAELVNEDDEPLLAAPTSVVVGGVFHGHTRIPAARARSSLTLELGAEARITGARRSETQPAPESSGHGQLVDVTIDVHNRLTHPATMQVEDQVPVAMDGQTRVRLLSTSPANAVLDDATGLVTFALVLEPGAAQTLTLSYEVTAPAGYRLQQRIAEEVTR